MCELNALGCPLGSGDSAWVGRSAYHVVCLHTLRVILTASALFGALYTACLCLIALLIPLVFVEKVVVRAKGRASSKDRAQRQSTSGRSTFFCGLLGWNPLSPQTPGYFPESL